MPARCHACILEAMRTQAFSDEKIVDDEINWVSSAARDDHYPFRKARRCLCDPNRH
jgi:hypothetical protein